MDSRLASIIHKNVGNFERWIDAINNHHTIRHSGKEFTPTELHNLSVATSNILAEISNLFFEYGNFKDEFDNGSMYHYIYGPNLIIKSIKTNTTYNLGVDERGIYISANLRYPENLKDMDDQFWQNLLKLTELGKFEFIEHEWFDDKTKKKHPELFLTKKSTIFRILRKYFIDISEDKEVGNVGEPQITWTSEYDFEDIIIECCLAFKLLYKLNYSLWKIEDLKKKRKKTI